MKYKNVASAIGIYCFIHKNIKIDKLIWDGIGL